MRLDPKGLKVALCFGAALISVSSIPAMSRTRKTRPTIDHVRDRESRWWSVTENDPKSERSLTILANIDGLRDMGL